MSNRTVNISFEDNLLRDIDRAARRESRSRSEFLREAARAYIQRRERWERIFAAGHEIARRKRLSPGDVSREIQTHRENKAACG
jgi:metal-responsive CopG/Arc/MetJ family transcriptional regulator